MSANALYYGDNLDILRRYIRDESVDLIYLDPPFNSNATYNVLFGGKRGERAAAQLKAFVDTWHWDESAARAYQEVVEAGGGASEAMQAFRKLLGTGDMMAYLAMMAPRLIELRRVLKSTGSIYLHCDPTASHYLRVLMDAVFGPERFMNEVIWKRTHAHGSSRRYGPVHDVVLFYAKASGFVWTSPKLPHDPAYIAKHFRSQDADGRHFQPIALTGAGTRHGESGKPWRGVDPTKVGRHWALPSSILARLSMDQGTVQERLDALDRAGLIYWPEKEGGTPRLKSYTDELEGVALSDIWTDIPPISANAAERLGYPTQKPLALLERIIQASSNPGDLVLDPFCGCGTTVAAAQKLGRRWVGIDITHLAINLMRTRLRDMFGSEVSFSVIGEPTTTEDAAELAATNPYQFQYWALGLAGARPAEQKKGADKGIDGRLYFHDDRHTGATKQVIFSVKAGGIHRNHVHELRGVIEREAAVIGVLITMNQPTRPMREEAASAGFYVSPWDGRSYPRLQLVTVAELIEGRGIQMPAPAQLNVTYQRAQRAKADGGEQPRLPGG